MQVNRFGIAMMIVVIIAVFGFLSTVYTVDETQQVVVTQFGRVVGEPVTASGLHFRIPFIQRANVYPKNIQAWDGDPGQIPTRDKTYIWVDSFARWRITDPVAFLRTVTDQKSAISRLDDIINPAIRNVITSHELIETVRNSNRPMSTLEHETVEDEVVKKALKEVAEEKKPSQYRIEVGREALTKMMLKEAQPKLDKFGIELIDVKVKRINYVEEVRKSVYDRMIAERNQMAEKIRSIGQGEVRKIEGDRERDLRGIRSEAYRQAEEIMGTADATATHIYAGAYGADPEFYSFVKSLDVYKTSLGKSDLIMSMDSKLLQYLNDFSSEGRRE